MQVPVVYNSREPRPGEEDGVDYHFRSRDELEAMAGDERYLSIAARDDLQVVDLSEVRQMLHRGDVFYEGNVHVALSLLRSKTLSGCDSLDVFLSPLSLEEVHELNDGAVDFDTSVTKLMRNRLLRRLHSQKPFAALPDLEDIEVRAAAAPHALRHAADFSHVLPCHDGEDSDHWTLLGQPVGDARRTTLAMAGLLRDGESDLAERWPRSLLGSTNCDFVT